MVVPEIILVPIKLINEQQQFLSFDSESYVQMIASEQVSDMYD